MAGKLIGKDEAEKLTSNFRQPINNKNFYYYNADLVIELLSQAKNTKYLGIFQGYDDDVPCFVLAGLDSDKQLSGALVLEHGSSCPPDC